MSIPFEAKAADGLEHLGLKVAARHLDQAAQQAAANQWSYTHFLGYLLDANWKNAAGGRSSCPCSSPGSPIENAWKTSTMTPSPRSTGA